VAQKFAAINDFSDLRCHFLVPFQRVSSHFGRVLIFLLRPLEIEKLQNQIMSRKTLDMRFCTRPDRSSGPARGNNVIIVCPSEENMSFRPLHDRILVRRVESEEKTKGGIIIPDTAKEKPQEGQVIAVGPGARNEAGQIHALDVKAGDRILFGKWSGTEIKINGEDLLIMKESDVLGILQAQAEHRQAA
jgi:chaperonin GroES